MSDAADRVIALLELRRVDEALTLAGSALAADPSNSQLTCLVGVCYLHRQEPHRAIPLFQNVIATAPEEPDPYRLLSIALGMVGDHASALVAAQALVELAPHDVDARVRLAECLKEFPDRRDEALANARWILAQRPDDPEAHLLIAIVLAAPGRRSRGDLSAAEQAVDRAAALAPGLARIESVRALVGVRRRRPTAALRAATNAVLLAPTEEPTRELATQVLRLLVVLPYAALCLAVFLGAFAVFLTMILTVIMGIAYVRAVRRRRWAFVHEFARHNRHYALAETMLWVAIIWLLGSSALTSADWVPGAGALFAILVGGVALLRAPDPTTTSRAPA